MHREIGEVRTERPQSEQWLEKCPLARQPGLCYDTKEPGRQARDLLLERNSKLYDEFETIGRPLPVRGAGTVRPERLQEREG